MRNKMILAPVLAFAAAALITTTIAQAAPGDRFRERIRARMAQRMQGQDAQVPRLAPAKTFSYGSDPLQKGDLWFPEGHINDHSAPLIVFVHGGGWKRGSKDSAASRYAPEHFTRAGYVYAAINYRLVPAARVEDQAEDVARAVKALLDDYKKLGIDPSRVVLTGHSAGAHLVALVGTDEQYLKKAGLSFANIRGVIPNDGAAYDVAGQVAQGGKFMKPTYEQAFGTDPARQKALSPMLHAAAPNAPDFLLIHVMRKDGVAQNKGLEAALKAAGTRVERREFPGEGLQGHAEINRRLGDPDYAATGAVDVWLKALFSRQALTGQAAHPHLLPVERGIGVVG
ncbi:MAG: alpha/beta hydrolase [Novosphingobium sp.]